MNSSLNQKLSIGLLTLRVTIALVFVMWGLDKILVPEHAVKVFAGFYGLNISIGMSIFMGIARWPSWLCLFLVYGNTLPIWPS
ncbi:hypothetical protein JCM19231_1598 [Vibrio ishigakensis]|uniref:DoxX family protein n=2 Tax=Vibrio ishigakensis TaxID=1481914 RepID=A0A0B8NYS0_9VIBR|nr:hypothetical protein JCM19231_1598 [Vibrio ishigakensis]